MQDQIIAFSELLNKLKPQLNIVVDAPDDAKGEYFIDISDEGNFSIEVSYRLGYGFGFYVGNATYGQKPDEVFRTTNRAAQRVLQLLGIHKTSGTMRPLTLVDMRELLGLTQVQVAIALSIKQPSVQRIEKRGDNVQVDTIAKHIQAMGGRLEMSAVFDDMEVRLELPPVKQAA